MDSEIFERPWTGGGKAAAMTTFRRFDNEPRSSLWLWNFIAESRTTESGPQGRGRGILTTLYRMAKAARGRPVLAFLAWVALVLPVHGEDQPIVPKMVFAHYMVCCPAAGLTASVDDIKKEIGIAQSNGIDGFALNTASWSKYPYYRAISRNILQAAEAYPGFKIILSFDDVSPEDSAPMLVEAAESPSYLRIDGNPVVSTYSMTPEWGTALIKLLSASGTKPFMVPNYQYLSNSFTSRVYVHPTADFIDELYRDHKDIDGYLAFGPDLGYPDPPLDGALTAERSRLAHKVSMIGIMPYYRGLRGNFRVFENGGFEGMAAQWTAAIKAGIDWVEIVTWNDWGEDTYVAPFSDDIRNQDLWNYHWGPLLDHQAFLRASRYYIDWFKSSRPPVIEHPAIYYFYRLHAKTAYGIASPDTGEQGRPKGWEKLVDAIHVTSFLPKPLTLVVTVGDHRQAKMLAAGVQHVSFDMTEGPVTITALDEQGQQIARKQLEFPITRLGQIGNFNYFAGEIRLP